MQRQLLFICLLMSSGFQTIVNINQCSCREVLKEDECDQYYGKLCEYDTVEKVCKDPIPSDCPFLTQFGQNTCCRQLDCAWIGGQCVNFTKSTDYKETVDDKCNNINANCATQNDGTCGVMKLGDCETLAPTLSSCTYDSVGKCVLYRNPVTCVRMTSCEKVKPVYGIIHRAGLKLAMISRLKIIANLFQALMVKMHNYVNGQQQHIVLKENKMISQKKIVLKEVLIQWFGKLENAKSAQNHQGQGQKLWISFINSCINYCFILIQLFLYQYQN